MHPILSSGPYLNEKAIFNSKLEVGQTGVKDNLNYDFMDYKINNKSARNIKKNNAVKEILENYGNASKILQLGFSQIHSETILSCINRKNYGNIRLTCVDDELLLKEKNEIDTKFPYEFEFIFNSIFDIHSKIDISSYDMIFITKYLTDEELYSITKNYNNIQIIIFFLETLDIINFFEKQLNGVIYQILMDRKTYVVDMKFTDEEVDKFPYLELYDKPKIIYTL